MAEVETPVAVQKEDGSAVKASEAPLTESNKVNKPTESPSKNTDAKDSEKININEVDKNKNADQTKDVDVTKEVVEALNLLAQGKRNMLCGEVPQAVQQLQEACRLLAAKYGDTADECGEAYLSYGTALLDLARMESGVLGNALEGIDSEDDEKAASTDDEKMTDSSEEKDTESEVTEAESEDIADEEGEEEGDEDGTGEGETSADESKPGTSGEGKADEEEVSNLQLAWEILELAKVIYTRHESKDMKLKAAEAHLKLGEVGLETEQYETAIEDFTKCLAIQKEHLEPESRLIAETHYQIGLASCFSAKYDPALEHLRKAVEVINAKIKKLQALIDEDEKSGDKKERSVFDDPIFNAQKEIKDLKEILPDILAKIEDTEDEKKSQEKVKQMVKENLVADKEATTSSGFDAPTSSDKSEAKAVSDISHLVRKKRKPEDDAEPSEESSKKPRQEDNETPVVNGGGDAKPAGGEAVSTSS